MLTIDHGTLVAGAHGIERSEKWRAVAKRFIKEHGECLVCGRNDGLQVHHAIVPFHIAVMIGRSDLELDQRNLVALCETNAKLSTSDHHFYCGHWGSWHSWAPTVFEDAARFKKMKPSVRERAIHDFWPRQIHPKSFNIMTDSEKRSLRKTIDSLLPLLPK